MKSSLSVLIVFLWLVNLCFADESKSNILIVYYSKMGSTKTMAEAVAEGANIGEDVTVKLITVDSAKIDDVKRADAIIIGSPVYNANTAPEIQQFINKWPFRNSPMKNKIGAAFVSAGGISAGEEIVLMNILKSMLVFGMIIVGGDDWQSSFGASAIISEKPFNNPVAENFIEKAKNLGKRVAEITVKFNKTEKNDD